MPAALTGSLARGRVPGSHALAAGLAVASLLACAVPAHAAPTPDRVYELVSSPHKSAGVSAGSQSTPDGTAVAFYSYGAIGDQPSSMFENAYVARRIGDAWQTTLMTPQPIAANPGLFDASQMFDFSADLRVGYSQSTANNAPGDENFASDVYATTDLGVTTWLSPNAAGADGPGFGEVFYAGRSEDGAHVVVQSTKPLVAGAPSGVTQLYDVTATGTTLLSVLPDGTPSPTDATYADAPVNPQYWYAPSTRTGVSAGGQRVVFKSGGQLYVRIDGTATVMVSASAKTADPANTPAAGGATFQGASADTNIIVFTSTAQLLDDPAAATGGVYAYNVDAQELRLLAALPSPPGLLNVVRVTPDGQRVYLATNKQLGGQGAPSGSANLFLLEGGATTFIASLALSGDSSAWLGGDNASSAQVSPDGRWLAFRSSRDLTGHGGSSQAQVYRYDADTGELACASCPTDGTPPTVAAQLAVRPDGTEAMTTPRNFTADGRLYFQTAAPLLLGDDDAVRDVYERDADGGLRLVTPGTTTPTDYVDNSVDGRDVFVRTGDTLRSDDRDGGLIDIYDARVGGVALPEPPAACQGEACRGPLAPPATTPDAPPSVGAQDDEEAPSVTNRVTFKRQALSSAARRRWARTGRATVRVRVSGEAAVRVRVRGTVGGTVRTIADNARSRTSAGVVSVPLTLSKAARTALRRHGRLAVRLTVTCTDAPASATTKLVLRRTGSAK